MTDMRIRIIMIILSLVLSVKAAQADNDPAKIEFTEVLSNSKGRINLIYGGKYGDEGYIFSLPKLRDVGIKRYHSFMRSNRKSKSLTSYRKSPDYLRYRSSSLLVNAESDTVLVFRTFPHFAGARWELQTRSDAAIWCEDESDLQYSEISLLKDFYFGFRDDGDAQKFKESCLQDCDDLVFGVSYDVLIFVVNNGKIDCKSSYCLDMYIAPYKHDKDHPLGFYSIPIDDYISEYLDK